MVIPNLSQVINEIDPKYINLIYLALERPKIQKILAGKKVSKIVITDKIINFVTED